MLSAKVQCEPVKTLLAGSNFPARSRESTQMPWKAPHFHLEYIGKRGSVRTQEVSPGISQGLGDPLHSKLLAPNSTTVIQPKTRAGIWCHGEDATWDTVSCVGMPAGDLALHQIPASCKHALWGATRSGTSTWIPATHMRVWASDLGLA